MKNVLLKIQYDGSIYQGFQIQKSGMTIQGELEKSIEEITGEKTQIIGCSRTDSGVSARNYILNFKTNTTIPIEKLMYPLNNILPNSIRVFESKEVPMEFHSRYNTKSKTYSYTFINSNIMSPLEHFCAQEKTKLDYSLMKDVINIFIGEHDFKAFMSSGSNVKSTVRTIYSVNLEKNGDKYIFTIEGDGFLYNMVRIIVGTIVYVGQGVLTKEDVKKALLLGDRKYSGKVMPPEGLILEEVKYNL